MNKEVDHIIIGGVGSRKLTTLFPYVHGVISIRTGRTIPEGTDIISITFDTLETNERKLLTALIASALVDPSAALTVYGREVADIMTDDIDEKLRNRIQTSPLTEFTFDSDIAPLPFPILAILAHPGEATPLQSTEEGAQKSLRDTKRALLNLLEDDRSANEKVVEQTKRLEAALAQASALADARASFISAASHQLRTPLTSIRWFSEMLINGDAGEISPGALDYIKQIDQGLERIINLVNFLLRSARIESRRVSISPTPLNICKSIIEVTDKFSDKIKQKRQDITIDCPKEVTIPLDAEFFDEALSNLILNAHLYSPEGGKIEIKTIIEDDSVFIDITDNGMGIKESDRERVFDKFFRTPEAVIASPDGSGLGLAYAREIARQWNGDITLSKALEKGTTFRISIPRAGMDTRIGEVKLND